MDNSREYGYVRVSSKQQHTDRQIQALIEKGVDERFIFVDKQSGKDFNREQYQILKNALRNGDTLYIKSLDRLGRNYSQMKTEFASLVELGVNIVILDMPLIDTREKDDLMKRFLNDIVIQVLSFVAESERSFSKERQFEGIKCAKARGVKFGRPRIDYPENWNSVIKRWENKEISGVQAQRELGLKHNTFYNLYRKQKEKEN